MKCPRCDFDSLVGAQYCEKCGASLKGEVHYRSQSGKSVPASGSAIVRPTANPSPVARGGSGVAALYGGVASGAESAAGGAVEYAPVPGVPVYSGLAVQASGEGRAIPAGYAPAAPPAVSGGYAPAAPPAVSGGYAPAAPPAVSGGYAPAAPPAVSGGYAPAAPPAVPGGYAPAAPPAVPGGYAPVAPPAVPAGYVPAAPPAVAGGYAPAVPVQSYPDAPAGGQTHAYSPSLHGGVAPAKRELPVSAPVATPKPEDRQKALAYAAFEMSGGPSFYVAHESAIVGRGPSAEGSVLDVDLASVPGGASVSRRHAQLVRGSDEVVLEDLGSANGTFVNGERLLPGVQKVLGEKDEVRFGAVNLVFHWRKKK